MRLMLKFNIPVEKGNETAINGTMRPAIEALIEQVRPEVAYFMVENGERAGIVVFEESDPSRLVRINEPLFAKLNAALSMVPVLTMEELRRGLP